jgi:MFS family permease
MAEPESRQIDQPSSRRSALLVVCLVMFIDLLGFGIVLPLLPRYGATFVEPLVTKADHPGLHGAIIGGLLASFSTMQFIFAPIWGRISDRKGRRPFLILGLVGSVLFYALFGVASELGKTGAPLLGLILLFVARIGGGIAGATVSTAQAVIADTTTADKRSRGMALIGAAFGFGFTFGPAIGYGALTFFPEYPGSPGFVASVISFIALAIAIFRMPETVQPDSAKRERSWLHLSGWRIAFATPTVGALILAVFLSTLAFACFEPTLALLTQDVLKYKDASNFLVFVYVGLVLSIAQGGFYQTLARRGVQEMTFMLTGGSLMIAGFVGLAAIGWYEDRAGAAHLAPVLAVLTIAVMGYAFVTPSVQSLISRRSDPAQQGTVLGVNQSANALSRILGPMAGVPLYYIPPGHAWPYVFSVALLIGFIVLALQARRT